MLKNLIMTINFINFIMFNSIFIILLSLVFKEDAIKMNVINLVILSVEVVVLML